MPGQTSNMGPANNNNVDNMNNGQERTGKKK